MAYASFHSYLWSSYCIISKQNKQIFYKKDRLLFINCITLNYLHFTFWTMGNIKFFPNSNVRHKWWTIYVSNKNIKWKSHSHWTWAWNSLNPALLIYFVETPSAIALDLLISAISLTQTTVCNMSVILLLARGELAVEWV